MELCREQWHELRSINIENMIYVKEDLIIPHVYTINNKNYTFYDFIANNTRGKSGPLFHFDAFDDVRLLSDATVEKNEVIIFK